MTAATRGGRFVLRLGKSETSFSTKQTQRDPLVVTATTFQISKPGRHSLELICGQAASGAALHWIEISGEAAEQGAVLRKRWRPAAAHTRFSSSNSPDNVRLWVMEWMPCRAS